MFIGISYKNCISTILTAVFVSLVMLHSPCFAATVALSWDANTESTLAGYRVYYKADSTTLPFDGTGALEGASPINVSNWTTATVSGLDPGTTYYFAVTAYDTSGAESSYSNTVTIPAIVVTFRIRGDINADGMVDVGDALLALQIAIGKLDPTAEQIVRGDVAPVVNGISVPNGTIDIGDVIVILGKVTGKIVL